MVIRIFVVFLDEVVVNVLAGEFGFDLRKLHGFEFEHHHGTGGVLGEGLVDFDSDVLTWDHFSVHKMGLNEFLS